MKNFILLLTLLLPLRLLATDCISCECETDWTLEVRGAYYQPSSKRFSRVFTKHLLDYQVEAAKRIFPFGEIWAGVSWASKRAHTQYGSEYDSYGFGEFRNRPKIFILPVSLGGKFIYPIMPRVDVYAGAGVCYSFLKIKNHFKHYDSYAEGSFHHSFKKVIYKQNWGAIFKLGFQIAMSESTFLDFFADYYSQFFHISHHKEGIAHSLDKHELDCSGFKLGLALGVYF